MFKSVTYEGFENAPELRAQCEAVTARLAARRFLPAKRIGIHWRRYGEPLGSPASREVEVRLTDELIGSERLRLSPDQLSESESAVEAITRRRMSMLDQFLDRTFEGFENNRVTEGVM